MTQAPPTVNMFRLRYVCAANLCRSPLAERLTALRMAPFAVGYPWLATASAGTHGEDGLPMNPLAARMLAEAGADPSGFTSSRLTAAMVAGDDLVLTADLAQRDAVVALFPGASRRTFLIREFVRVARHLPEPAGLRTPGAVSAPAGRAVTARELVAAVARLRGRVPWREPGLDEIADPNGTAAAITACAGEVDRAVTQIVALLTGSRPRL